MALALTSYWWAYVLLGLAAGVLSGTLGLGSGIIVIPPLVLLFAFSQKSAQGMALAVMVPMAFVGALRYWLNPDIEIKLSVVAWIVVGALIGALIGTELAYRLPGPVLKKMFAVFLMIVACRMLISPGKSERSVSDADEPPSTLIEKGSVTKDAET